MSTTLLSASAVEVGSATANAGDGFFSATLSGSGSLSATVLIEGSPDSSKWHTMTVFHPSTGTGLFQEEYLDNGDAWVRARVVEITGTGATVVVAMGPTISTDSGTISSLAVTNITMPITTGIYLQGVSARTASNEIHNVSQIDVSSGVGRPCMVLFEDAVQPGSAVAAADYHGLDVRTYGGSANINVASRFYCIEGKSTYQGANTLLRAVGVLGSAINTNTGTLTLACALQTDLQNTGTGRILEGVGLYVPNAVNSGGGVFTTAAGIKIETQTGGSTNYAIHSAGNGIWRISSGSTLTAGGHLTQTSLWFGSTFAFGIFAGSGAPSIAAAQGSLYLRNDGTTTNDRAYINNSGTTTWTALITAA